MKVLNAVPVMNEEQTRILLADPNMSKSAKVKALFDQGYEVRQVANMVGIRYNFAYNVIRNYIVVNDVQVEETKKESKKDVVWAMFDQGITVGQVSKELKMNYNYAWKLHKEWERAAAKEVAQAEAQAEVK